MDEVINRLVKAFNELPPEQLMRAYLEAIAQWSDEDMKNPIIAIAARNSARDCLDRIKDQSHDT